MREKKQGFLSSKDSVSQKKERERVKWQIEYDQEMKLGLKINHKFKIWRSLVT